MDAGATGGQPEQPAAAGDFVLAGCRTEGNGTRALAGRATAAEGLTNARCADFCRTPAFSAPNTGASATAATPLTPRAGRRRSGSAACCAAGARSSSAAGPTGCRCTRGRLPRRRRRRHRRLVGLVVGRRGWGGRYRSAAGGEGRWRGGASVGGRWRRAGAWTERGWRAGADGGPWFPPSRRRPLISAKQTAEPGRGEGRASRAGNGLRSRPRRRRRGRSIRVHGDHSASRGGTVWGTVRPSPATGASSRPTHLQA